MILMLILIVMLMMIMIMIMILMMIMMLIMMPMLILVPTKEGLPTRQRIPCERRLPAIPPVQQIWFHERIMLTIIIIHMISTLMLKYLLLWWLLLSYFNCRSSFPPEGEKACLLVCQHNVPREGSRPWEKGLKCESEKMNQDCQGFFPRLDTNSI